jgi:hypothetical protein
MRTLFTSTAQGLSDPTNIVPAHGRPNTVLEWYSVLQYTLNQGSGNTYRGLLFLVFGGTSQLTGISYLLQTVMWYISPS